MFTTAKRDRDAVAPTKTGDAYAQHKARAARRQAEQATAGRDIGPIPAIANPKRRARAKRDFRYFCKTYLGNVFTLPWSDDHKTVTDKGQRCVTDGGLFAEAMPRASGKTSIVEALALWAVLFGFRRFVAIIGADEKASHERLESIKITLETNDDLLADFPEACFPIRKLERIANRCKGQLCEGRHTYLTWTANTIRLPTTPGNKPGAILTTCGITGRIRGMNYKAPDGETIRPDLVIIDDPQTDESARSPTMTQQREAIITGAILGLAGPNKKIAALMPCTVITEGDLADRMLNHDLHPDWQGERLKMVYKWPDSPEAVDHWKTYAKIRAEDMAAGKGMARATAYYRKHRRTMDAGAVVAWPQRKNDDELSALQHAYNLQLRDARAFAAEFQNEPLPPFEDQDIQQLEPRQLEQQTNGYTRRQIPPDAEKLTSFIDVQKNCLYYAVVAWRPDFTGYVVDYGTFPDQRQAYFSYRNIRHTLAREFPKMALEGQLFHGLEQLTGYLFGDNWDGYKLDLCLVDANWGESTDIVYSACRQLRHRIYPSHGKWVGATSKPIGEYRTDGARGLNWLIPTPKTKRQIRHVLYDANYWKSHLAERLLTARGDAGSLTFHKGRDHRLFAEHIAAEYRIRVEARGRVVHEWKARPSRPDNHWLDCLVGSCVAASICGVQLPEFASMSATTVRRRKRKAQGAVSYL